MKIDFSVKLISLKGEPLEKLDNDKKKVQMTLSDACADALLAMLETDRAESGKEKYKRWQLASKIIVSSEVDLDTDDISFIKERVGKLYGPATVGPVFNLLEGKEQNDGERKGD